MFPWLNIWIWYFCQNYLKWETFTKVAVATGDAEQIERANLWLRQGGTRKLVDALSHFGT